LHHLQALRLLVVLVDRIDVVLLGDQRPPARQAARLVDVVNHGVDDLVEVGTDLERGVAGGTRDVDDRDVDENVLGGDSRRAVLQTGTTGRSTDARRRRPARTRRRAAASAGAARPARVGLAG